MSLQDRLVELYEMIEQGNPREAEAELRSIFHGRRMAFADRYVALKGICRAMDLQGKWTESETVWSNLHSQLQLEQADPLKNRGAKPLWVVAGLLGLVCMLH